MGNKWFSEEEISYGYHVETLPELSDRRAVNLWDEECLKLHTGIKAVWILFRRGRWELLDSIGLPRWKYEAKFMLFDERYINSDHGLLKHAGQAEAFADFAPGVRLAASTLIGMYKAIYCY